MNTIDAFQLSDLPVSQTEFLDLSPSQILEENEKEVGCTTFCTIDRAILW